ncbi:MAG: protein kinase [Planctomycetota bacterium]
MTDEPPFDETLPSGPPGAGDETIDTGSGAAPGGASPQDTGPDETLDTNRPDDSLISRVQLRDLEDSESPLVKPGGVREARLPPQIGKYQVAGEIARGGVGAVFKARYVELGRDIALKVLLDGHRGNEQLLERFTEEAQIGGQLQHPGIVPVHELGAISADRPYFAMKLVKGRTLSLLLRQRETPNQERSRFIGIFEQICQPLAYAHARGVIHRDLKPSNVMVGAFGEVQVMDWGLAKVISHGGAADDEHHERKLSEPDEPISIIETVRSGSASTSESIAGSVLGTPAYMPPEQARGQVDDLDERSDVFGLGAILCEVLTGAPPYRGDNIRDVHHAARDVKLDDAMSRLDECGADPELMTLAKACLAAEPSDRPRDAGVVATEVRKYLESIEGRARDLAIHAAEEKVKAEGERKARRLTSVLAVVVLVTGALGAVWWRSFELAESVERGRLANEFHARLSEARSKKLSANSDAAWKSARESADLAIALSDELPEVRADAEAVLSEVESARRLWEFLRELTSIAASESVQTTATVRWRYKTTFQDFFGEDITLLEKRFAVERIRATGYPEAIARALDRWWILDYRAREKNWLKKFEIAVEVRPASWREFFRDGGAANLDLVLKRALEPDLHPSDRYILAGLLMARGNPLGWERVVRRATELHSDEWWPHYWLGSSLLEWPNDRTQDAIDSLLAATGRTPNSVWVWNSLARAYTAAEDYPRALSAHSRRLFLRPGHSDAYFSLSRLLQNQEPSAFGPALAELPRRIDQLYESGVLVHPLAREVLAFVTARGQRSFNNISSAIETLEAVENYPGTTGTTSGLLAEYRKDLPGRLVSFASIDAALVTGRPVLSAGATWRFFRGVKEPSPSMEWTAAEFDDSAWEEGESGFGYADDDDRTVLSDMRGKYSTVYIRKSFELPNRSGPTRYQLRVLSDDGWVGYLNGREVARRRAKPDRRLKHRALASGTLDQPIVDVIELSPGDFRDGENVFAFQGFNISLTSSDFSLEPVLIALGVDISGLDSNRKVFEQLKAEGNAAASRISYYEARLFELRGEVAQAADIYRRILLVDPDAFLPRRRLFECLVKESKSIDSLRKARALLVADDARYQPLWNEWLAALLGPLGFSAEAALKELPPEPTQSTGAPSYITETRWALESLRSKGGTARIQAGGDRWTSAAGVVWERDRFFTGGSITNAKRGGWVLTSIRGTEDDELYSEGRFFRPQDPVPRGYRIPVPKGRYRVTLHFAETYFTTEGSRVFQLLLEDRTVLKRYDAVKSVGFAKPNKKTFETDVQDGILDITFLPLVQNPRVCGVEIERLE